MKVLYKPAMATLAAEKEQGGALRPGEEVRLPLPPCRLAPAAYAESPLRGAPSLWRVGLTCSSNLSVAGDRDPVFRARRLVVVLPFFRGSVFTTPISAGDEIVQGQLS